MLIYWHFNNHFKQVKLSKVSINIIFYILIINFDLLTWIRVDKVHFLTIPQNAVSRQGCGVSWPARAIPMENACIAPSPAHRREKAIMHVTLWEGRDAGCHFVVAFLILFIILTIVTLFNDRFRENGDRYWLAIVSILREDFILKSMMIGESMKNMAFWTIYFLTSMLSATENVILDVTSRH